MNLKYDKKISNTGFTIIEVMISVAIFVVVVVIGIGSLLSANDAHKKTQKMRSTIDNLSFIMEDMSRNLRTGNNYKCTLTLPVPNIPTDCVDGKALSFKNNNFNGVEWLYAFDSSGNIVKSNTGSISDAVQLNPDEIKFDGYSGFTVVGAVLQSSVTPDNKQPYVIIRLSGKVTYKGATVMPFLLQTSVSQRLGDI